MVAPISDPATNKDAIGQADADGIINATHDIAAGATLTCRYFCDALNKWLFASATATASGISVDQYGTAQWLVPPQALIHIKSGTAGNITVGGLKKS